MRRPTALRRYDILDTLPDGAFDRITALPADLFSVPISIVSLVCHDRICSNSRHGLAVERPLANVAEWLDIDPATGR
jgi:hypothetical protein